MLSLCCIPALLSGQVTIQRGADLWLDANSLVSIQGDLETDSDIEGAGMLLLTGSSFQTIDLKNHSLPGLSLSNSQYVSLASPMTVNRALNIERGNLQIGSRDLTLGAQAIMSGSSQAYIATEGKGAVVQLVNSDRDKVFVPIGTSSSYVPLTLTKTGTDANGVIRINANSKASPEKPSKVSDYLGHYWTIDAQGIRGELKATANYANVVGDEQSIVPTYWDGIKWSSDQSVMDRKNKMFSMVIPKGHVELYAMSGNPGTNNGTFSIVPNPVKQKATLLISSAMDQSTIITVRDVLGRPVIVKKTGLRKGANQVSLDRINLAPGSYSVSSVSSTGRQSLMFVKQ